MTIVFFYAFSNQWKWVGHGAECDSERASLRHARRIFYEKYAKTISGSTGKYGKVRGTLWVRFARMGRLCENLRPRLIRYFNIVPPGRIFSGQIRDRVLYTRILPRTNVNRCWLDTGAWVTTNYITVAKAPQRHRDIIYWTTGSWMSTENGFVNGCINAAPHIPLHS